MTISQKRKALISFKISGEISVPVEMKEKDARDFLNLLDEEDITDGNWREYAIEAAYTRFDDSPIEALVQGCYGPTHPDFCLTLYAETEDGTSEIELLKIDKNE